MKQINRKLFFPSSEQLFYITRVHTRRVCMTRAQRECKKLDRLITFCEDQINKLICDESLLIQSKSKIIFKLD